MVRSKLLRKLSPAPADFGHDDVFTTLALQSEDHSQTDGPAAQDLCSSVASSTKCVITLPEQNHPSYMVRPSPRASLPLKARQEHQDREGSRPAEA